MKDWSSDPLYCHLCLLGGVLNNFLNPIIIKLITNLCNKFCTDMSFSYGPYFYFRDSLTSKSSQAIDHGNSYYNNNNNNKFSKIIIIIINTICC
jgi:hypothetical protein